MTVQNSNRTAENGKTPQFDRRPSTTAILRILERRMEEARAIREAEELREANDRCIRNLERARDLIDSVLAQIHPGGEGVTR